MTQSCSIAAVATCCVQQHPWWKLHLTRSWAATTRRADQGHMIGKACRSCPSYFSACLVTLLLLVYLQELAVIAMLCLKHTATSTYLTLLQRFPQPGRYESVQDGLIDRDEFAAGLARMGLSYASSSLDLDEAQQAQLLGVLFKDTPSAPASDRVTLDVFDANLLAVKGLDSMADTYMLLDPWCYNGRSGQQASKPWVCRCRLCQAACMSVSFTVLALMSCVQLILAATSQTARSMRSACSAVEAHHNPTAIVCQLYAMLHTCRLLKIRPGYTADAFDTPARIAAAAMLLDGNGVVLDTRMPAYLKTASAPDMNPCPTDWGNGIQGSTNYSHFAWANASIGFKWGKALPSWCLDETWPGTFPDDAQVYGALAGQAVLPGCEPSACKPLYRILAQSGSVHVQVLPYQQDVWNATGAHVVKQPWQCLQSQHYITITSKGAAASPTSKAAGQSSCPIWAWQRIVRHQAGQRDGLSQRLFCVCCPAGLYQTMIGNCEDGDGQLRCFYKGWADGKDASLHPKDEVDWQTTMDPCYADSMDCSDTVQAVTATGHGIPMHEKWFWSSRKVYMELEPAWYLIMSASECKHCGCWMLLQQHSSGSRCCESTGQVNTQ